MPVPDQDVRRLFTCHERERLRHVRGREDEATTHRVCGVQAAADARVVDDRDQMGDPGLLGPTEAPGVQQGVVPVLDVQPRNDLRHTGRAAGQLERTHVERIDVGLDRGDPRSCLRRRDSGAERLHPVHVVPDALGRTDGEDRPQGRVTRRLLPGELDEVETEPRLDDVTDRPDHTGDVTDLVRPMRRECRHRDESRFETPVPDQHRLDPIPRLEQHGVTRRQPEIEQPGGQLIGTNSQLGVSHRRHIGHHGGTIGETVDGVLQPVGQWAIGPLPRPPVGRRAIRGIPDQAITPPGPTRWGRAVRGAVGDGGHRHRPATAGMSWASSATRSGWSTGTMPE